MRLHEIAVFGGYAVAVAWSIAWLVKGRWR